MFSDFEINVPVVTTVTILGLASFIYSYHSQKDKNIKKSINKFTKPIINPVKDDFNWETEEPIKYRPFKKGKYNMTLAIKKLDPNDFICIEKTYLKRIKLREYLFDKYKFFGCDDSAIEALKEMYKYIFNFLNKKYPKYFQIIEKESAFINNITGKKFPLNPDLLSKDDILRLIATNIEEDMLIMLKNPNKEQPDEYILRSTITCFAAGFNPSSKLNKNLSAIHQPVPNYETKLQFSMNKFFSRISKNEFVVRINWSVQTHGNLCAPVGNHGNKKDKTILNEIDPETLDFNKCFLRCEKQCVTRLPETGAIMMIIRTYVTSLMKLRMDLNDEEKDTFCEAIDGISGDLAIYKRKVVWGNAVKKFIKGESNGINPVISEHEFVN